MTNPKRKRRRAKDLRLKHATEAEEEYKKAPHSFVFHRGKVGKLVRRLILDVRHVMEPYTASHLQMKKQNVLRDFVSVSGMLNVSHFLVFTKSDVSVNLHVGKVPRGPTIVFRVTDFSPMSDVLSFAKRPNMYRANYSTHPLLVMNNFASSELHVRLVTSMFQNMFPSINVNKVKLNTIRRCVLLNYNREKDTIDFRHYVIRVVPSGMSRAVKKLIRPKLPDLGRYGDISEYIDQGGNLSGSEAESEGEHNKVVLPQRMRSKGNVRGSKSAIRLLEVGPRMTLKLHKIEEGFWGGGVLYNALVVKTPDESKQSEEFRRLKMKLKEERRKGQLENVRRKAAEKQKHKERSLMGMKKQTKEETSTSTSQVKAEESGDDDDAEYYRQEVGHAPDKDLHLKTRKRKSMDTRSDAIKVKARHSDSSIRTISRRLPVSKQARFRLQTGGGPRPVKKRLGRPTEKSRGEGGRTRTSKKPRRK